MIPNIRKTQILAEVLLFLNQLFLQLFSMKCEQFVRYAPYSEVPKVRKDHFSILVFT